MLIKRNGSTKFSSPNILLCWTLNEQNQPDHIINFPVECFSFVSRDIKDKDKFILMMLLSSAESSENFVMGRGKLFFGMLKGLNGQLHSSGESFLNG